MPVRFLAAAFLVVALVGVIGCGEPRPSIPVNAILSPQFNFYVAEKLDKTIVAKPNVAIVVGQVRSAVKFAERGDGKWNTYWFLAKFDVVSVAKGVWSGKEISFVVKDSWPDPRSGIMLDMASFPYRAGAMFAFALDTSTIPATILAQERRPLPTKQ